MFGHQNVLVLGEPFFFFFFFLSVFSVGYRSCFLPFNSSSKQNQERREGEGQGRRQRQRCKGGICRSSQRLEDSVDDQVGSGAMARLPLLFFFFYPPPPVMSSLFSVKVGF